MKKTIAKVLILTLLFTNFNIFPVREVAAKELKEANIGDYIKLGKNYSEDIKWRIINKEDVNNDGKEELMLISDKLLDLKAFDVAESGTYGNTIGLPIDDGRESFGSNNWEKSNIRQWLNSFGNITYRDQAPTDSATQTSNNGYENEEGFLDNFNNGERKLIVPVKHKTLLTTYDNDHLDNDGGTQTHTFDSTNPSLAVQNYDDTYYKMVDDKVFLLSIDELDKYIYSNTDLADSTTYYKAYPTKKAIENSEYTSANLAEDKYWNYFTRTPGFNASYTVRTVEEEGDSLIYNSHRAAYSHFGIRPSMYISGDITITSGEGTKLNSYEVDTRSDKTNESVKFDGSSYIKTSHKTIYDNLTEITINVKLKPDNLTQNAHFISHSEGGSFNIGMNNDLADNVYFNVHNGVTYLRPSFDVNLLSTTEFNNITATYDGSSARIYLNGVLMDEASGTGNIQNSNTDLIIGGESSGTATPTTLFSGNINDVAIYNKGLLEPEVPLILDVDLTGESNLIAYYKFEEATGSYLKDSSINDNTMKLFNAKWQNESVKLKTASNTGQIKIGEYLKMGKKYGEDISFRVLDKKDINNDGKKELMIVSDKIIDIKPFDGAESGTVNVQSSSQADNNREINGSNNWEKSNLREWLNSEMKVNWSTTPPTSDSVYGAYNEYESEKGFLNNFNKQEKSIIIPVKHKYLVTPFESDDSNKDGGIEAHNFITTNPYEAVSNYENSNYKTIEDKVFMLSVDEANEKIYNNMLMGNGSNYILTKPTEQAVNMSEFKDAALNNNDNWDYWLRTPNFNNSYSIRSVEEDGSINSHYGYNSQMGIRPSMFISPDVNVLSGTGLEDNQYVLDTIDENQDASLIFDGVDDYVDLGDIDISGQEITLETWIKIPDMTVSSKFIGCHTSTNDTQGSLEISSGTIRFELATDVGGYKSLSSTSQINANEWTHISAVYDGSEMKMYINGTLDNSISQTGNIITNDLKYALGKLHADYSNNITFKGEMKNTALWNKALTESELNNNINNGIIANEPGLVAFYDFNESAGNVLKDKSSNNNDGKIYGATWTGENVKVSSKKITGDMEIGDYFEMGSYNDEAINWRIINKDENGLMLVAEKILTLKAFDAKGDNVDGRGDANRTSYGANYWEKSNIREWLNSSEADVTYTHNEPTSSNVWNDYNEYDLEKGFLSNFTDDEKSIINETYNKVLVPSIDDIKRYGNIDTNHVNNTNDPLEAVSNYNEARYKIVKDKVGLLSIKELNDYIYSNSSLKDNENFYKSKPTIEAINKSEYSSESLINGEYFNYSLRTPITDTSDRFRYVNKDGSITTGSFYRGYSGHSGIRPVIYINTKKELTVGDGSKNNPFKMSSTISKSGELSIGNYLEFGRYKGKNIKWRVIGKKDINGDGKTENLIISDKIIDRKPFDAAESGIYGSTIGLNLNNNVEMYGSSDWETSNIREWLNSTSKVNWLTQPPTNSATNSGEYSDEKGFLNNFSNYELSKIISSEHKSVLGPLNEGKNEGGTQSYNYGTTDPSSAVGNYDDAYYKKVIDKAFLLSTKELDDYIYSNTALEDHLTYHIAEDINSGSDYYYFLRTPGNADSNLRRTSNTDVTIGTGGPQNDFGIRPAMYIDSSIKVKSGSGSESSPYKFKVTEDIDGSLNFDGDDDYVNIGRPFSTTEDISITAKFKLNEYSTNYRSNIFAMRNGYTEPGIDIAISGDKDADNGISKGTIRVNLDCKSGQGFKFNYAVPLDKVTRMKIEMFSDKAILYINGGFVQEIELTEAWSLTRNVDAYIGKHNTADVYDLNGEIYEFKIESINSENKILHYEFDEAAGNYVKDYSGNENHGIINGASWNRENEVAYEATKTDDVSIGEYFKLGNYNDKNIDWIVVNKDEEGVMLVSEKIMTIKPFDAAESGTYSGGDRANGGANRWSNSNIKQWLNSNETSVNFTTQAPIDAAVNGNSYNEEKGFLTNFSANEREAIKNSSLKSLISNSDITSRYAGDSPFDYTVRNFDNMVGNYDNAYFEISEQKLFLPSTKEVHDYIYQNKYLSKDKLERENLTNAKPTKLAVSNSEYQDSTLDDELFFSYYLRDPDASSDFIMSLISKSSNGVGHNASGASNVGIRPSLYLKYNTDISGEGTKLDPYVIDNIDLASYLKMGKYNGEDILWRAVENDKNGTTYITDKIITYKAFDANNDGIDNDRISYGSNNWEKSSIRDWLNSNTNPTVFNNNKPTIDNVFSGYNPYDNEAGFLTNFKLNEYNAINEIEHKSILSGIDKQEKDAGIQLHVRDSSIDSLVKNYDDAYFKYIKDKVYLPSAKEMYEDIYLTLGSQYKAYPTSKAVENTDAKYGVATNLYSPYYMRTPYTYNSYKVRKVGTNDFSNDEVRAYTGSIGIRPMVTLKNLTKLTGEGTEANPHKIVARRLGETETGDYYDSGSQLYQVTSIATNVTLTEDGGTNTISLPATTSIYGYGTTDEPYKTNTKLKPLIQINSPIDGSMIQDSFDISLDVGHEGIGENIDVYYNFDSGSNIKLTNTSLTSTGRLEVYNNTIDSSSLSDGMHVLNIWTQDTSGEKSIVKSLNVDKSNALLSISSVNVTYDNGAIRIEPVVSNSNRVDSYKYEITLNGQKVVDSEFIKDSIYVLNDIQYNQNYTLDYVVTVKDNLGNLGSSPNTGTETITTDAKNPLSVEVYEKGIDYVILKVVNSLNHANPPEHEIKIIDNDTSDEIVNNFSNKTKVKIDGVDVGKTYTIKTQTRSTTGTVVTNDQITWVDDLFISGETEPPEIKEFTIDYGEKVTEDNTVLLKLLTVDNRTRTSDLKVQFYIDEYQKIGDKYQKIVTERTNRYYGLDENGNWQEGIWGEYRKYYENFYIGENTGKKAIHVRVADEILNIGKHSDDIIKETRDNIEPTNEDVTMNNPDFENEDNEIKYDEASGYYKTAKNVVDIEVKANNAKFVQYSFDGITWSPWELVESDNIVRNVTLFGENGLKTIYLRTKSEFDNVSAPNLIYYMLDKESPNMIVSTETSTFIAKDGEITFNIKLQDDISKEVEYQITVESKAGVIQNIGGNEKSGKLIKKKVNNNSNVSETLTGLGSGFYNVIIEAIDELGNTNKQILNIWSK